MSLPLQSYTWDRIRSAFARYVGFITAYTVDGAPPDRSQVTWVDNDQGPMPKPFVSLSKLSGVNSGFASEYYRDVPTSQLLTITQTVDDEAVVCKLIWSEVRTAVVGGDSPTDTRDKFLLAMQATIANTREPLIFASSGVADIVITARPFAFPDVTAVQGCTLLDPAPASARAYIVSVSKTYRVRMQLFAGNLAGDDASDEIVSMLKTGLETTRGLDFLEPYGVGVQGTPSTDQVASVKSGGVRERRAFFDFTAVTRQTTYTFDAAQQPAIDETVDQVDPPSIEGVFV